MFLVHLFPDVGLHFQHELLRVVVLFISQVNKTVVIFEFIKEVSSLRVGFQDHVLESIDPLIVLEKVVAHLLLKLQTYPFDIRLPELRRFLEDLPLLNIH